MQQSIQLSNSENVKQCNSAITNMQRITISPDGNNSQYKLRH